MQVLWTKSGTARVQAWDDPLNLDLMTYDRHFEPIVLDGKLFVGYSDRDKVAALDASTGKHLWSFYTDAPIRLPPAGFDGRVYFTSDDGHLYCVDADSGELHWKFSGGPSQLKVIGNRRLVSAWPARGGVVVRDGNVYFAASIWPFMGIFVYSLDAETGAIAWVNDSSGSTYIKQPHSAPSFAGIAPQGALVATDKHLIIPGGRSVPAVFDRETGELKYYELNAGGKGTGGSFVIANDDQFFVHTRLKGVREFDLHTGDKTAFMPNEPVLHNSYVYTSESAKDGSPVIRAYDAKRKMVWEVKADGSGDLILAGTRLYAAGAENIAAIDLPNESADSVARVAWQIPTTGKVARLIAADQKLFAVTLEGSIFALGQNDRVAALQLPTESIVEQTSPLPTESDQVDRVQRLLAAGDPQGYALWFGARETPLVHALASTSPFTQLAIVDADPMRVATLRSQLDSAMLYGRVTAHQATPTSFGASPYIAHMIFVGKELATDIANDPTKLNSIYQSVRPYGGTLQLLTNAGEQASVAALAQNAKLEQATIETSTDGVVITRQGALPGSADWTHQHGDIGNTRKSNDSRVKLPLGILWFGGSSNADVLPRHGHGPPQQVIGGRLFIEGIDKLSARDVYTGRVLWQRTFDDLGTRDVYFDETYKDTPLDPAYNQVHIPGANARGTNYVVTEDRIYIIEGNVCRVLRPETGELIQDIALPQDDPANPHQWSYIGVYEDILIGGLGFAQYRDRLGVSFDDEDSQLRSSKAGFGSKSLDRAGSLALVGFDRKTGEQLWRIDARHSFWNNAIVAGGGLVYCLDKNPKPVEDKLKRRGTKLPDDYRIVAVDAKTGKVKWQHEEGIFGTWLGYSEQADLLLQAGAAASDRLSVEVDRGMTVYNGKDGTIKWSKPDLKYSGPCVLHNDLIITNANSYSQSAGAFHLSSGAPHFVVNPLTGEKEHWKLSRAYGCNTILASENLLTFRSGAAGFYDLNSHSGTGNFGGFKSGCTGNLIAAGGVLNAPDYTRTCSCSYQNQTSLALVHMPDIEMWTLNEMIKSTQSGQRVHSLGVNFGAPGQRRSPEGTLWIESPGSATESPPIEISISPNAKTFRRHSSSLAQSEMPWLYSSGIRGNVTITVGTVFKDAAQDRAAPKSASSQAADSEVDAISYRLRLYFNNPSAADSTDIFDVIINDKPWLSDIAIRGGEVLMRELPAIEIGDKLKIQLIGKHGEPSIAGLELLPVR
jgi:outer membrane protein assembly factor BamB